ncbi:MAG: DUF2849 domain-containing protein [Alphaproteobacteria bacterium]|nr:DUF2849 domain-containing protein [Alphaproteobacteria bacterium]
MSNDIHVITANRLTDGIVVYFQSRGQWSTDIEKAVRLDEAGLADALSQAKEDAQGCLVVGIYEVMVRVEGNRVHTLSAKEDIRARHKPTIGPSA